MERFVVYFWFLFFENGIMELGEGRGYFGLNIWGGEVVLSLIRNIWNFWWRCNVLVIRFGYSVFLWGIFCGFFFRVVGWIWNLMYRCVYRFFWREIFVFSMRLVIYFFIVLLRIFIFFLFCRWVRMCRLFYF